MINTLFIIFASGFLRLTLDHVLDISRASTTNFWLARISRGAAATAFFYFAKFRQGLSTRDMVLSAKACCDAVVDYRTMYLVGLGSLTNRGGPDK